MMKGYIKQLHDGVINDRGMLCGRLHNNSGNKFIQNIEIPFEHIAQIGDELLGFTIGEERDTFLLIGFDMDSYRRYINGESTENIQHININYVMDRDKAERIAKFHKSMDGDPEFKDYCESPDGSGPFERVMTARDPDAETVEAVSKKEPEAVNHPSHYGGDTVYEVIKCLEAWFTPEMYIGACRGQAIIYLARADRKEDPTKDLNKASKYIEFEVDFRKRLETGNVGNERAILMEFLSKMDSNELIATIEFWEHKHR